MKELWTQDDAEFHGKYYNFPPVRCNPKPVQKPHPPVFLGGNAPNVFKRIAAWGDGWMPVRVTPEQVKMGRATLDELAEAAGRDPKTIRLMVCNVKAAPVCGEQGVPPVRLLRRTVNQSNLVMKRPAHTYSSSKIRPA